MIEFGGVIYYIDLEAMDKAVNKILPEGESKTKELKTYIDENGKITAAEIVGMTGNRITITLQVYEHSIHCTILFS